MRRLEILRSAGLIDLQALPAPDGGTSEISRYPASIDRASTESVLDTKIGGERKGGDEEYGGGG